MESTAPEVAFCRFSVSYLDSVGIASGELAGGLRIRRILSAASANQPAQIRSYTYTLSNEPTRSSGSLSFRLPSYVSRFVEDKAYSDGSGGAMGGSQIVTTDYYVISSNWQPQSPSLSYREVTEWTGAGETAGKTVHYFTSAYDYQDRFNTTIAPPSSYEHRRGKLTQLIKYAWNGTAYMPITRERYTYSIPNDGLAQLGRQVTGMKIRIEYASLNNSKETSAFDTVTYHLPTEWIHPVASTTWHYDAQDSTHYQKTTQYTYFANTTHQQQTANRVINSAGEGLTTIYRYPLDLVKAGTHDKLGVSALVKNHMLTSLVEQQIWRRRLTDSVLVAAQLTHYNNLLPKRVWRYTPTAPVRLQQTVATVVLPTGEVQQDPHYQETEIFDQYDELGNLLQYRAGKGAPPVCYVWGYRQTIPVAEVHNATQQQVQAALTSLPANMANGASETELRNLFAELRQRLPQSKVSGRTHQPLVGVSTETGPDGRTIFYEYDALGRLLRVRDEQNRVLRENEYHYARP